MNETEKFFNEGLLKKIPADLNKMKKSLEAANKKLETANKTLEAAFFELSILESYTSMFHSARALLYRNGIQEKSHYATMIYIREKYNQIPIRLINSFNVHRIERHDILYGLDFKASEEDAENALEEARDFLKVIKNLLSKK